MNKSEMRMNRGDLRIVSRREAEMQALEEFRALAEKHSITWGGLLKKLMDYGAKELDKRFSVLESDSESESAR